jgi:glycosyltransferase involved in cell wall biosynthesis
MKILYHIPGDVVGGAETQVQALINNLPEDCTVIVTVEKPAMEVFVKTTTKAQIVYRMLSPNTLLKQIEVCQPDVIQFYHSPMFYNALTRSRSKAKVVEVAHNRTSFPWDASTYPKDRTDILVCVSPDAEAHFRTKRQDVRSIVIPNGIDQTKFFPDPHRKEKLAWRRPLGGFCGRLEGGPGKGIDKLVEIMRAMDVDFELVGYDFGNFGYKLRGTNIKVLPFTNNVAAYYQNWNFFVSTSPKEGFGLAIAEALASGLPSVIYNCGGICHYIEHKKHAYVAEGYDEIAPAIEDIISGKAFYDPASLDLSARSMAAKYAELYRQLLAVIKNDPKDISVLTEESSAAPSHPYRPPVVELEPAGTVVLGIVPTSWHGIRHAIEARVTHTTTPEQAVAVARKLGAKKVVFGGFSDRWYAVAVQLKQMGCEVVATWHSTAVLDEFDPSNRRSLLRVIEAVRAGIVDYISTPHEGMARTLSSLMGVIATYEPNYIMPVGEVDAAKRAGLNIGLFGSGMAWKNCDTQILAVAVLKKDAILHTQTPSHLVFAEGLGVPTLLHSHYDDRATFYQLAASMQLSYAVGITETFGYFAAESYLLGVPAIFSSTTPSMRGEGRALKKAMVSHIDDPAAIADATLAVLDDYEQVLEEGREHVKKHLLKK